MNTRTVIPNKPSALNREKLSNDQNFLLDRRAPRCHAGRAMSLTSLEARSFSSYQTLILKELQSTLAAVSEAEIAVAQRMLLSARRVFVTGAGRSGLALKMVEMRL